MNYNPSPKSEFVKNPDLVKNHHELVEDPRLRISIETAMQELERSAAQHTDPTNFNACASAHLRMLGAHDFVNTFYNLAEQPVAEPRKDSANLPSNLRTVKGN